MNDIKLGGAVDSIEDGEGLQRDLDKTESWSITNNMKFKSKCWILHLVRGTHDYMYILGDRESSPAEKESGGFC